MSDIEPKKWDDWFYKDILCRLMEVSEGEVWLKPYYANEDIGNGSGMNLTVSIEDFKIDSHFWFRPYRDV